MSVSSNKMSKCSWDHVLRPYKVSMSRKDESRSGSLCVEPLERGYGHTIGNALRRVLLSSIKGYAITGFKMQGALSEYTQVPGLREDVSCLVLNLKQVKLSINLHLEQDDVSSNDGVPGNSDIIEECDSQKEAEKELASEGVVRCSVSIKGPCVVTAGMLAENNPLITVYNPDQYICTLDEDGAMIMDFWVENGVGYSLADERKLKKGLFSDVSQENSIGFIPIDANFNPIESVMFDVEKIRVGDDNNYDKLLLDIETDGSIDPKSSLVVASKILQEQFAKSINEDLLEVSVDEYEDVEDEISKLDVGKSYPREFLKKIEELELSQRGMNCLKNNDVYFVGDLVVKTESQLLSSTNFGKKSLDQIKVKLAQMGLSLAMDVQGWVSPREVLASSDEFKEE
jgi:DNA-directed RNA polymerase subunit alpha